MPSNELVENWLRRATIIVIDRVQATCGIMFPTRLLFHLRIEGFSDRLLNLQDAGEALVRSGKVPVIADVAVSGIVGNSTVIEVLPSAHDWVGDADDTWGGSATGPFKATSWILPSLQVPQDGIPTLGHFLANGEIIARSYKFEL